jgi:anti-sigma factor RsiW
MQHLDEGTIHSWLDGALSGDEAARVGAHVKECPECTAAVAEARGFIAASSRILTALDQAPRGVIPAAAPKKRVDPLVWRIAATLLVVAAGTLVVVQNRGSEESPRPIAADRAPLMPHTASDESAAAIAQSAAGTTKTAPAATARAANAPAVTAPAKQAVLAASEAAPGAALGKAPMAARSRESAVDARRAENDAVERKTSTGRVAEVAQQDAPSSGYAMAAPTAPAATQSLAGSVGGVDVATEPERLKVVGTPRALGFKITLYEVAPGDTVTLTEPIATYLNSTVVTAAPSAPLMRAREKAAAPPAAARADAAAAAVPDSQNAAVQSLRAPVRTPSVPAPVKQVEVANGVTTISWTDHGTGSVLRLSGRMPEARLQQIKIRIERERAAAAKKNP